MRSYDRHNKGKWTEERLLKVDPTPRVEEYWVRKSTSSILKIAVWISGSVLYARRWAFWDTR